MLWLILILVVCALIYYKNKKAHSYWKEKGVKYCKPLFLVGNMNLSRSAQIDKFVYQLYSAYPEERYHGFYQFLSPSLLITDPELIKQIGVKDFDSFMDHRSFVPPDVDKFWARNLFAVTGNRWRDMRTTLSPSFTSSKMKIMFSLIDECAQDFVKYFEEEGKQNEIQEMEMKDIVTRFTNDVIASTAFGLKCDSLKNKNNEFYLMGKKATSFTGLNLLKILIPFASQRLSKLLNIKMVSDSTVKYFTKIISDTIQTREENNIIRPDMIHLLLEAQKGRTKQEEEIKIQEGFSTIEESTAIQPIQRRPITIDDIVSQAFLFFLAGFDTVSTVMSFVFYELAVNPDIQIRLRNEMLAIDGNLTYEKILSIKYLDMIVSEVLRRWPPTILTDRKVTKAFTIEPVRPNEKSLRLEPGMIIWLPQFPIQRDPQYFPDPDRFDPERFSDENKHNINPSTYIPFGIGPRACIGSRFALLEMKLLIYYTLKSFEIVPIKKTPIPMVLSAFIMAPKNGMWLGFKKI